MTHETGDAEKRLTRRDLELVIRRAAELTVQAADADERVSADELVRIGAELGLPERYVRQALFELPAQIGEDGIPQRWLARGFAPAVCTSTRVVPGAAQQVLAGIEEHLVAREYLQLRRRQPGMAWFQPADDALSSMSRALGSLGRHYHLIRAQSVAVTAHQLDAGATHVQVSLDFSAQRTSAVRRGLAAGAVFGGIAGSGAFLLVGGIVADVATLPVGWMAGSVAAIASIGVSAAAALAGARSRFRRRTDAARLDVDGMLDRLEAGSRLEPAPAPWLRRLRGKLLPARI